MIRTFLVAVLALVCVGAAEARPRHHAKHHHVAQCVETGTVLMPVCGMGAQHSQTYSIASPAPHSREARRLARGQELYDAMPFGMPTDRAGRAVPRWAARWTAKPRAWCGWWLARKKGIRDARLNLARNWATLYGSKSHPKPGAVVVWRHHVGELVSHVSGSVWIVRSGNDGNAVRERRRSIAGAIAFRA